MSEAIQQNVEDHKDAFLDMVLRRQINDFAVEPVSFNTIGLTMASENLDLTAEDTVLDIGCSSGQFIIEAAQQTGTEARIIGLEPDIRSYQFLPKQLRDHNFTLLQGIGEHIPIQTSSVSVVTAHNVLFRAQDLPQMLEEIKRVTKPDGLVIVSTNSRDHARWRHLLEKNVAKAVGKRLLAPVKIPSTPAETCYLEDIPAIIQQTGGLEPMGEFIQDCDARITRERLDTYVYSIMLTANQAGIGAEDKSVWRETAEEMVTSFVMERIVYMQQQNETNGIDTEPYFADTVHRGLIVLRNTKAA
jgi:ubiquinone/menaquinone biosynthesis C-methylase UbiE